MERFGTLPDGRAVFVYKIASQNLEAYVLNYGAAFQKILFKKTPVALGYDTLGEYLKDTSYQGALAGRSAGRLSGGLLPIDGEQFQLAQNDGSCNLHGGPRGLSTRLWQVEQHSEGSITLTYHSPGGEEGFPGDVDIKVNYSIKDTAITLAYEALSNRKTFFNPTNHCYFNLSGKKEGIGSHILRMDAEAFAALGEDFAPKMLCPVEGSPFDFRHAKAIGRDIDSDHPQLKQAKGYDHPFALSKRQPQIDLQHKGSGIGLKISSDQRAVIFYSGNFLKDNFLFRQGLCFETQNFPNAPLVPEFQNEGTFIGPQKPYIQKTSWQFYSLE